MLKRIWNALRGITPPPPIDPPAPKEGPYAEAYRRAIAEIDGDTDCTLLESHKDELYRSVRYTILWKTDSIRLRRHLVVGGEYPLFDDKLRTELERAVEDWHERRCRIAIRKTFP